MASQATTAARQPATASGTGGKAAPVATVSLRQIGDALAESHALPKRRIREMMDELVAGIAGHLKKGAKVRIGGFGVLQVRARPARMGRNPATGEPIRIKASRKIAFRPAKELKEAV